MNQHKRTGVVALLLLAGLSACSLPTQHEPPAAPQTPTKWQHGSDSESDTVLPGASWWQEANDEQLDALIRTALVRNRDIARNAVRLEQALLQARMTVMDLGLQPSAGVRVDASTVLSSSNATAMVVNGVNFTVPAPADLMMSFGMNAGVTYAADVWSRLKLNSDIANNSVLGNHADLINARLLVTTQVAEQYWKVAAIDATLEIQREVLRMAEENLTMIEVKRETGKVRAVDVERLKQIAYEARLSLETSAIRRATTVHALALLLDELPESYRLPAARLPAENPGPFEIAAPVSVLDRRPDVRNARLALDSSLKKLNIAEANRYPQISLGAAVGTGGAALRQLLANPLASLGLSIALPVMDGSRTKARRDLARQQLEEAIVVFRDTLYKALVEVEGALAQDGQSGSDVALSQLNLAVAERVVAQARLRFSIGADSRLFLNEAQLTLVTAQRSGVEARLNAWIRRATVFRVMGGATGEWNKPGAE